MVVLVVDQKLYTVHLPFLLLPCLQVRDDAQSFYYKIFQGNGQVSVQASSSI